MNFNDVLAQAEKNPSGDPEEISKFIDELIAAPDFGSADRSAFCGGYMAGMFHALAIIIKSADPGAIVGEVIAKETGWATTGLFG